MQRVFLIFLLTDRNTKPLYPGAKKVKTVLFLSQVTSHRFFGKGSVAMETAFPWDPWAAQVQRHSSTGSGLWLAPLGLGGGVSGSTTEDQQDPLFAWAPQEAKNSDSGSTVQGPRSPAQASVPPWPWSLGEVPPLPWIRGHWAQSKTRLREVGQHVYASDDDNQWCPR